MLIAKWVTCKKCGAQRYNQQAYQFWHNIDCIESFGIGDWHISWVKNWWICTSCAKKANLWEGSRFHDIDGHQYSLNFKFPFIHRG